MTAPLTAPTCNTSITTDQPPAPLPCGLIPESTCRAKSETPHNVVGQGLTVGLSGVLVVVVRLWRQP